MVTTTYHGEHFLIKKKSLNLSLEGRGDPFLSS